MPIRRKTRLAPFGRFPRWAREESIQLAAAGKRKRDDEAKYLQDVMSAQDEFSMCGPAKEKVAATDDIEHQQAQLDMSANINSFITQMREDPVQYVIDDTAHKAKLKKDRFGEAVADDDPAVKQAMQLNAEDNFACPLCFGAGGFKTHQLVLSPVRRISCLPVTFACAQCAHCARAPLRHT